MANDCVMLGGGGGGGECENGGIELSLELSIGGSYAKSEKLVADGVKSGVDMEENGRSSGGSGELGLLVDDPQAKREIQALRRREAKKKREGKLKRVNGCSGSGSGNDIGDLNSDHGDGLIERESKKGKTGDGIVGESQGTIPVVGAVQFTNGLGNFYGGMKSEKCGLQPTTGCRSFRPYQGNRCCGREGGPASATVLPPGQSPSAFSDYHNTNMLGGNASDNGSNSSYSQPKIQQQNNIPSPTVPPEQSEPSNSSKQTESKQAVHSSADSPANPSLKPSEMAKSDIKYSPLVNYVPTPNIMRPPPRPQTENNLDPTIRPHMPCVSTTGNGPNGKTVMGFLYRYNKDEVSIVCVCHGSSFSPAEFVEHAGGIDITNPLRHITVIPSSAFGV